jgi:hypothetical protein
MDNVPLLIWWASATIENEHLHSPSPVRLSHVDEAETQALE